MLARLLINKRSLFFLGFVLMAYLKIPVTGIAILGAIVARRDGQYAEICGLATGTCAGASHDVKMISDKAASERGSHWSGHRA